MKMRFGYTTDPDVLGSKLICRVTGGAWSHVFPVFYPSDGRESFYFESIFKRDELTCKTGVRGPRPLSKIRKWVQEKPGRRFALQPEKGFLMLTDDEAAAAETMLKWAVGVVTYPTGQIGQNWLQQRTGIDLSRGRGSATAWDCSETCLRILPARVWPFYGIPNVRADNITPSGNKLASIEAGTATWIQAAGVRA